ncbi:DUF4386 domain-containing protein [Nonomuraea sp. NPDC050310]|uniref:DUF4386 domain-containing protein n=1 Tax=Nonomuraea sp. NPDC050310 TaxID=3154935 RepID=UPI00340CA4BC
MLKTDRMAGVLALAGMLAGVLSIVPVLEEPGFLALVPAREGQLLLGAVAQLVMIPAYAGFALCLHRALKAENETLALGFVGFRLIAAAFHVVGVISLPLILLLARQEAAPDVEVLAELLRSGRDLVNHVALIIALGLGDLLMFAVFFRSRLVPRWLSVWGLLGVGLAIVASVLVLLGVTGVVTPFYLALNAPLAVQTLVLALWLIVRGLGRPVR